MNAVSEETCSLVGEALAGNPQADIEFLFNRNIHRFSQAHEIIGKLRSCLSTNDSNREWHLLWLASMGYFVGDSALSRESLRRCAPTTPAQRTLYKKYAALFGFSEAYSGWLASESEHIRMHHLDAGAYSFDLSDRLAAYEAAYADIDYHLKTRTERKIDLFLWHDRDTARICLGRGLGFAIPQYYLIHAAHDQSIGHEIAHIAAYYIGESPPILQSFICEGTAVLFDQSHRNYAADCKRILATHGIAKIDIEDCWSHFAAYPWRAAYGVAAAFCQALLACGIDKYRCLLQNQAIRSARQLYGPSELSQIMRSVEMQITP